MALVFPRQSRAVIDGLGITHIANVAKELPNVFEDEYDAEGFGPMLLSGCLGDRSLPWLTLLVSSSPFCDTLSGTVTPT